MDQAPQLDVQGLAALLGVAVPLVVGLITKKYASPVIKAICNVVLAVAAAVIALWAQYNGHVTGWAVVNTIIVTFVASLSAYKGIWKPLNVANWTGPGFGLGSNATDVIEEPGAYRKSGQRPGGNRTT